MNNRFFAQAEVFVEIVRQGSLSAAAGVLRLSKSNVSQKLAELERDLDATLLQRNTRTMQLTAAGERVFALCADAVDGLHHAHSQVSHRVLQTTPRGMVHISGPNLYLTNFIMPLLPGLRQEFPHIQVHLTGGDAPADPKADNIDLRFRVGPVQGDGARVFPLPPMARELFIHQSLNPLAQTIVSPDMLGALPLVLRAQEPSKWVFHGPDGQVVIHQVSAPVMRVTTYELAVGAVCAGLGAALLAVSVMDHAVAAGDVMPLLPDWSIAAIPVSLVAPLTRLRRAEVSAVAHYIVDRLQDAS